MQPDLFAHPTYATGTAPGHRKGSQPSADGAAAAAESFDAQTARAYRLICERGGCTIHEVARALGVVDGTASARVRALVLRGDVIDSGTKRRNAHSGIRATVWVARQRST